MAGPTVLPTNAPCVTALPAGYQENRLRKGLRRRESSY
jgi:hypothetical protein